MVYGYKMNEVSTPRGLLKQEFPDVVVVGLSVYGIENWKIDEKVGISLHTQRVRQKFW